MKEMHKEMSKELLLFELNKEETLCYYDEKGTLYYYDKDERQYYEKIKEITINKFIDNLYNVSQKEINLSPGKRKSFLNERNTFIIRKIFGVFDNGIFQDSKTVGNIVNLHPSRIHDIKKTTLSLLKQQIQFKEIIPNNKKNIVTLSDQIQKLNLPFNTFIILHRSNIKTIEDLTLLSKLELHKITKCYNYDTLIIDSMQKFGFSFKNNDLSTSINVLDLSDKAKNRLTHAKINTVAELVSMDKNYLLSYIGNKDFKEINSKLNIYGLSLLENDSNEQTQQANNSTENKQPNESSEEINILEKYKSLLLEKKELQNKLNELDTAIMFLLEQINQNQIGETNERSRK